MQTEHKKSSSSSIEKAQAAYIKAQQRRVKAEAKLKALEEKRIRARKWLPLEFEIDKSSALMCFNGYSLIKDFDVVVAVKKSFEQSRYGAIFGDIATALNIDRHTICILHTRKITRQGKPIAATFVRYVFNQEANEFLKEECEAKFDSIRKAWNIIFNLHSLNTQQFLGGLNEYFDVIVDADSGVIWKANSMPSKAQKSEAAFAKLPFHVSIASEDIFSAIEPSFKVETLVVHDGKNFQKYNSDKLFAQSPFLLLRYSVQNGSLRYASYSVLGRAIEEISFGSSRETTVFIARYMDTCASLGLKGFITDKAEMILESPNQRGAVRGNFSRLNESINDIRFALADISFFLLCSDYVSLTYAKYGADSAHNGVIAYANLNKKAQEYYRSIGRFFYTEDEIKGFPIIITREYLDSWSDDSMQLWSTIIHELGHYLTPLDHNQHEVIGGSHGVGWAIYCDLLYYIGGEFCSTVYCDYSIDKKEMTDVIDAIIIKTGIPLLPEAGARQVTRAELDHAWHQCIKEFLLSEVADPLPHSFAAKDHA